MQRERTSSSVLRGIMEKYDRELSENPVVGTGDEYPDTITTHENVMELQDILIKTVIDYVEKNGLKDIYALNFHIDSLQDSVEFGEWHPGSDSSLCVEGLATHFRDRKDGKRDEIPFTFVIDESF